MASRSGMGFGSGATVLTGALVVVAVVLGAVFFVMRPGPERVPDPAPVVQEVAPDPTPAVAEVPAVAALTLDVVRVDAAGEAVIAGRGQPEATVAILLDGAQVHEGGIDGGGDFVAMLSLGLSEVPRLLTVQQTYDGQTYTAADAIVIEGRAPIALAEAPAVPIDQAPTMPPVSSPLQAPTELVEAVPAPLVEATPPMAEAPLAQAPDSAAPDRVAVEPDLLAAVTRPLTSPEADEVTLAGDIAREAPRLVRISREAAQVIQAGQPDGFTLSTIAYTETGDVTVSGVAAQEGFVRLYLDNEPVLTTEISPQGDWKADLSNVEAGVYTLRVDEVDADGKVTARVETPFERTAPELVQNALGADPQPALSVVTVQPGHSLWRISEEVFGDGTRYIQLFKANKSLIRDPDLIYPGQVFTLPDPGE